MTKDMGDGLKTGEGEETEEPRRTYEQRLHDFVIEYQGDLESAKVKLLDERMLGNEISADQFLVEVQSLLRTYPKMDVLNLTALSHHLDAMPSSPKVHRVSAPLYAQIRKFAEE